jgi:hypothetical protein
MAKTRPRNTASSTADLDWYLISIDRLKKIGIAILAILLAAGGYFYYDYRTKDPQLRAQKAIAAAQGALNELAASKDFATYRTDFDRGSNKLDEAKSLFTKKSFPQAEAAAIESQTVVTAALARIPGEQDADAQFLTVEGVVQYQKNGVGDFKKADARTPLFNGDWVKTSNGASAELIFSNGSLYTVGPNALLEIYSVMNPATSKKQNSVQMRIGSVEINTTDDSSTVRTPGTQVVVQSASTAQVGIDSSSKTTQVVNLRGTAAVGGANGKPSQTLAAGQQVVASHDGDLSPITRVLMPPALLTPADNQSYQASSDRRVEFAWAPHPEAAAYQLQVSRSRLFGRNEIDARRDEPRATARVTKDGPFFWRVASVDANGRAGPYSAFRRFRVSGLSGGSTSSSLGADKTPPTLQLVRPFPLGGATFQFEGKAEPGSTVFINDQEIDVESDGSFRKLITFERLGWNTAVIKAVDAAGNQTVQQERVHVEE